MMMMMVTRRTVTAPRRGVVHRTIATTVEVEELSTALDCTPLLHHRSISDPTIRIEGATVLAVR